MRRQTVLSLTFATCVGLGVTLLPQDSQAAPTVHNSLPTRKGGNTGLGVSVGAPMGLSLKHFFADRHALQFHLAWMPMHVVHPDFNGGGGGILFDYLFHPGAFYRSQELDVVPYFGLGVGLGIDISTNKNGKKGHAGFIVKPPVGVAIHFLKIPIDVALEGTWAPYIVYGPSRPAYNLRTGEVSAKVRYYF